MTAVRLQSHPADRPALAGPIGTSIFLHVVALSAVFLLRPEAPSATVPIYRVDLIAAPAGRRAAGIVGSATAQARTAPTPPRPRPPEAEPVAREATVPVLRRQSTRATPSPASSTPLPQAAPQAAGGGPLGGRGTDVATVRTEGIEFPFPGYLENIVRQIAVRFDPPGGAAVSAEIKFLIRRDGSATIIQFVTRSGVFAFDLEAQAAVEAASNARAFGPLPGGFPDDVLPVVFSFDPKAIR
ncbi:MAG: TonB C-terminal domain-containing protein [Anaerolineae bacterium]|nr:TonB C-terminal domain-containing protein [Gemmatimonadaceae bacterium]